MLSTSRAAIQVAQGDLIGGADTLTRALALVEGVDDSTLLCLAILDRAGVYQKLAERCDYQRVFAPCYEALGLVSRPTMSARSPIAQAWGGRGLAGLTRESRGGLGSSGAR